MPPPEGTTGVITRTTIIQVGRSARRSALPTSPGRRVSLPQGADFGAELRVLRVELGWDRVFLSQLTGLDQSTISKLEKGQRQPTAVTLALLAQALDLHEVEMARLYAAAGVIPPGWEISQGKSGAASGRGCTS